ncbi:unnamed protein product [Gadus morhua 'NCC']
MLRCFAGGRSPAQWPDCNRVCEALFVQLCEEYRGSRRIDGVHHERWSLVKKAYLHIRQVVLNNATVMEKTSLQLPVVNTATLSSWYCKRGRGQEKRILEQGICPPQTTTVNPESLPPAVQRKGKPCMPQSIVAYSHVFVLPPNTAGTATLQGRKIRRVNPPSDLLRPPCLNPSGLCLNLTCLPYSLQEHLCVRGSGTLPPTISTLGTEYKMVPKFRKKDGCICLFDSEDAKKVKAEKRPWTRALSPDEVKESAREAVEHKAIPALPRAGSIKTEPTDSELMQAAAEVDPDTSQVDQHWISKALFRWSPSGQPEFDIDKLPLQPLLCQLPVQPLLCQLPVQPLLCQLPVQPLLCQLPVQPLLCQLPVQPLLCQLHVQPLLCQLHSLQLLRLPLCIVDTLAHGRFRASKKAVAPGVESTKRCFAGGRSPAQWPDCNRVCEALFVQLCEEYRGSRRIDGVRHERWSLVMKAYLHIRQVVLNNATVMEKTSLQLPVVNTATLSSWYCKRERGQEKRILEQGICPPQTTTVSPESLPPAVKRKGKPCMPQSIVAYSHVFVLPPNTAGTAKLQGRKIRRVNPPSDLLRPPFLAALEPQIQPPTPVFPTPPFIPPLLPQPLWSVPQPHLPALQPAGASVVHVPYTTTHYRRKKREEEEKTGFKKRKYRRSSATILCRQCQRERDPATHNQ